MTAAIATELALSEVGKIESGYGESRAAVDGGYQR